VGRTFLPLGSSEIPPHAWAQLRGLVSISLAHLFRKEEGLDNAATSLAGSSHGARLVTIGSVQVKPQFSFAGI
jgi:hypothetical protein